MIKSCLYFGQDYDKNCDSYKEVEEYVIMVFKPSIDRLCNQIMELYNNTIGSGACIIDTIQRGKHNHLIVTDEFKNNYYNKFVDLLNKIKDYNEIGYEEVKSICGKYCKYGDAKCYQKQFKSCYCRTKVNYCEKEQIFKSEIIKICDHCKIKIRNDCNCDCYLIDRPNYLNIYYATRKKFHGISFEKDGIKIFHFTFI